MALVAAVDRSGRVRGAAVHVMALSSDAGPRLRALEAGRADRHVVRHVAGGGMGGRALLGRARVGRIWGDGHGGGSRGVRAPPDTGGRGTRTLARVAHPRGDLPRRLLSFCMAALRQPRHLAQPTGWREARRARVPDRGRALDHPSAVRPVARGRDDELLLHGVVVPRRADARTADRARGGVQPRRAHLRRARGGDGGLHRVQPGKPQCARAPGQADGPFAPPRVRRCLRPCSRPSC